MGLGMEVVSGRATAPGVAAFAALTANTGNSFVVRNAAFADPIYLLQMWNKNNAAGNLRLRSPKLHDNVRGIHYNAIATDVLPMMPARFRQPLSPQDQLIFEITGSAVGGQIELGAFLAFYTNLPGIEGRFLGWDDVYNRTVNTLTVQTTHAV